VKCNSTLRYNIDEEEMDRVCKTHGGEEECILGFGGNAGRKETTGNNLT
jgi:hypothetical protein